MESDLKNMPSVNVACMKFCLHDTNLANSTTNSTEASTFPMHESIREDKKPLYRVLCNAVQACARKCQISHHVMSQLYMIGIISGIQALSFASRTSGKS